MKLIQFKFYSRIKQFLKIVTFSKDICPKVNVLTRLGLKLAYNVSAVQHFDHYTTRTSLNSSLLLQQCAACPIRLTWVVSKMGVSKNEIR